MKHASWRNRVRQLADPAWLGRTVDGYANLIAARLRRLAAEGSTGMLPMSGPGDSAIFFRDGQVVYAESSRTPMPPERTVGLAALGLLHGDARESAGRQADGERGERGDGRRADGRHAGRPETTGQTAGQRAAGQTAGQTAGPGATGQTAGQLPSQTADRPASTGELVRVPSVSLLARVLAVTEPTIDAATELVSSDYRFAKFRHGDRPPVDHVRPIPVETLLTEVDRRRAVLRQLMAVVTPDTVVIRQPSLDAPSAQVSRTQWALLARAGGGTTPRGLALQLGQSVFGTTIEAYRLIVLGLLAVSGREPSLRGESAAGRARVPAGGSGGPGGSGGTMLPGTLAGTRPLAVAMPFMRAVAAADRTNAGGNGGNRPDHR
jgi:hypothetical protein